MSSQSTALLFALSVSMVAVVSGCGPEARPGLIACGSTTADSPGTLALLRPGSAGKPWSIEHIEIASSPIGLWQGTDPKDGSTAWRWPEGAGPADEVVRLVPGNAGWKVEAVPGASVEGIEWRRRGNGEPYTKDFQLANGNVIHKAMWFEPAFGEPGILTISANLPMLRMWRKGAQGWTSETLWTALVGDTEQRFRDIEIGDVDGDGVDDLVVVTHNRGRVYVLEQSADGSFSAQAISEVDEPYFVHEVELGNVDGDKALEIFTTPSEPNVFDGEHQAGRIERFDFVDGKYVVTVVEDDPATHAKEILACDIDGDGRVEIFGAMEAKELREDFTSEFPGYLMLYRFAADGTHTRETVGDLVAAMCRFLNWGDTDGNGTPEVIASTNSEGIFAFEFAGGKWTRRTVAGGYRSGGFEHATTLMDLDGDGVLEVCAGSDKQRQFQSFRFDKVRRRWNAEKLCDADAKGLYFTWNLMPLPAGQ